VTGGVAGPRTSSWLSLLSLFTVAGLIEAAFWSQMVAFTPLFLRELGVRGQAISRH
jgi:hypothetical protein